MYWCFDWKIHDTAPPYLHVYLFPSSLRERMRLPYMQDRFQDMFKIVKEMTRLQVSYDEYLCMKTLLLLCTSKYW